MPFAAARLYGSLWATCGHQHRTREAAVKCAQKGPPFSGTLRVIPSVWRDHPAVDAGTFQPLDTTNESTP